MTRAVLVNGVPATGKSGFGVVSVSGLSLVPRPAARIIAFMHTGPNR